MYNNKIFEITNAYITTNEKGNKVLNIVLLGNQNTYEEISFINGTDIIIPLTITLKKEIETKTSSLKLTYTNEVTDKTAYNIQEKEYEEIDISILNKIGTVIPKTTSNVDENTIVYEDDEVKVEVIELLGKNVISNGGILYEEQIVRNKIKITNKSNISKNITITANLPKEILYAKLHVVGVVHNEEYDYYLRGKKYEYVKDRQVKETSIDSGALTPGATYEGYFDTYINDLNDDLDNVETAIRYDIKINKTKIQSFEVKNIIKQAEIGIEFGLTLGNNRENWFYDITVKNLTNRELKNVNVLLETSPFFEITTVTHELKNNVGSIEENLWTYTIESLLPYTEEYEINNLEEDECGNQKVFIIEGNVVTKKFEDYKEIKNIQGSEYELKGNCVVYGNTIMNK